MPLTHKKIDVLDEPSIENIKPEIIQNFGDDFGNKFIYLLTKTIEDKDTDWKNAQVTLVHECNRFSVVSGSGSHCLTFYTEDGETEVAQSTKKKYLDETTTVPVINKRVLGKAIIKYIGHEGLEGDERQQGLRKLLQAVIDYLQTHAVPGVWDNAVVTVYDANDNKLKFTSGTGEHRFVVNEYNGQPNVRYTIKNKVKTLKTTDELNKEAESKGLPTKIMDFVLYYYPFGNGNKQKGVKEVKSATKVEEKKG